MSVHPFFRSAVLAASRVLCALAPLLAPAAQAAPNLAGCELFPPGAIFSQRIDDVQRFPPHARSPAWLGSIGPGRKLHADWGRTVDPLQTERYYGIPVNVVDGTPATTRWPLVSHGIQDVRDSNGQGVPAESDCAVGDQGTPAILRGCDGVIPTRRRFPYPLDALLKAERGACNDPATCGDRHVLVLEQGACRLWESYFSYQVNGRWSAYATAAWDLKSMEMRPDGWTSADAAGLPILPLLARIDEVEAGVIPHALRVTFRDAVLDRRHTWPASHSAGTTRADGIPFGALLRLRADFDIPFWWTAQAKVLARAMQKYGLYVADIGSDFFVQGDPDERWNPLTVWQIQHMKLNDFEFVDIGAITRHPRFNPRSYQAAW
jgi:hypothetical protein